MNRQKPRGCREVPMNSVPHTGRVSVTHTELHFLATPAPSSPHPTHVPARSKLSQAREGPSNSLCTSFQDHGRMGKEEGANVIYSAIASVSRQPWDECGCTHSVCSAIDARRSHFTLTAFPVLCTIWRAWQSSNHQPCSLDTPY